jgi:molybdopterin-binding protein
MNDRPIVELTVGLFLIPFGIETQEGASDAKMEVAPGIAITPRFTNVAVDDLALAVGKFVAAIVRSSDVMVGVEGSTARAHRLRTRRQSADLRNAHCWSTWLYGSLDAQPAPAS